MPIPPPRKTFNLIRILLGIFLSLYGFLLLLIPDQLDFGLQSYMKMILGFLLMVIGLVLFFYKTFSQ